MPPGAWAGNSSASPEAGRAIALPLAPELLSKRVSMLAPLPHDEEDRLQELACCGVLDTPSEPMLDRITRLAARIFRVPTALISLVDRDRQWFKSRYGIGRQGHPARPAILRVHDPGIPHDGRARRLARRAFPTVRGRARRSVRPLLRGCAAHDGTRPSSRHALHHGHRAARIRGGRNRRAGGARRAGHGRTRPAHGHRAQPRRTRNAQARRPIPARHARGTRSAHRPAHHRAGRGRGALPRHLRERRRGHLPGPARRRLPERQPRLRRSCSATRRRRRSWPACRTWVCSTCSPADRAEFERRWTRRASSPAWKSEVYRADGARIWITENARAVRDADGGLLRYEGTVEDITARRTRRGSPPARARGTGGTRARTHRRTRPAQRHPAPADRRARARRGHRPPQREQVPRADRKRAGPHHASSRPTASCSTARPSVQHILGFTPDELIGREHLRGPASIPTTAAGLRAQSRAHRRDGRRSYVRSEARCRHRDGSWRLLESIASSAPPDFPVVGLVINSRDITDRRRAELEARGARPPADRHRRTGPLRAAGAGPAGRSSTKPPGWFRARWTSRSATVTELLPGGAAPAHPRGRGLARGRAWAANVENWRAPAAGRTGAVRRTAGHRRPAACPAVRVLPDGGAGAKPRQRRERGHPQRRPDFRHARRAVRRRRAQFGPQEVTFLQTVADLLSTVIASSATRRPRARWRRATSASPPTRPAWSTSAVRHAGRRASPAFRQRGLPAALRPGAGAALRRSEPAQRGHPPRGPPRVPAPPSTPPLRPLTPYHWEGRLRLPDGDVRWVTVRSRPERQPNGDIVLGRRGARRDRTQARAGSHARGQGGSRKGQPRQERVPLPHEPRAAHAAQRHPRLRPTARPGRPRAVAERPASSKSSRGAGTCSTSSTRCSTSRASRRAAWSSTSNAVDAPRPLTAAARLRPPAGRAARRSSSSNAPGAAAAASSCSPTAGGSTRCSSTCSPTRSNTTPEGGARAAACAAGPTSGRCASSSPTAARAWVPRRSPDCSRRSSVSTPPSAASRARASA